MTADTANWLIQDDHASHVLHAVILSALSRYLDPQAQNVVPAFMEIGLAHLNCPCGGID
jgi:hypothetical protein